MIGERGCRPQNDRLRVQRFPHRDLSLNSGVRRPRLISGGSPWSRVAYQPGLGRQGTRSFAQLAAVRTRIPNHPRHLTHWIHRHPAAIPAIPQLRRQPIPRFSGG